MIIPAVDIRKGKCVRLLQGRQEAETVFSDDPLEMAYQLSCELLDIDQQLAKENHPLHHYE